jgi:hypothetical protein
VVGDKGFTGGTTKAGICGAPPIIGAGPTAALPVRYSIGIQRLSYREGCLLYTHTIFPVRYVGCVQCVSDRRGVCRHTPLPVRCSAYLTVGSSLTRPCKIRRLPLDCHCNSRVNRQYRRGVNSPRTIAPCCVIDQPPALLKPDAVCTATPLPVRHTADMHGVSYREGCGYIDTPHCRRTSDIM